MGIRYDDLTQADRNIRARVERRIADSVSGAEPLSAIRAVERSRKLASCLESLYLQSLADCLHRYHGARSIVWLDDANGWAHRTDVTAITNRGPEL